MPGLTSQPRRQALPEDLRSLQEGLQEFIVEALRQELWVFQARLQTAIHGEPGAQQLPARAKEQDLHAALDVSNLPSTPLKPADAWKPVRSLGAPSSTQQLFKDPTSMQAFEQYQPGGRSRKNSVWSLGRLGFEHTRASLLSQGSSVSGIRSSGVTYMDDGMRGVTTGDSQFEVIALPPPRPPTGNFGGTRRGWEVEGGGDLATHEHAAPEPQAVSQMSVVKGSWYDWLCYVVRSPSFDYTFGIILMLNALVLGVHIDWQARHVTDATPLPFRMFEIFFCVVFATELILRIAVYRRAFFSKQHRKWSLFDMFFVAAQLVDNAMTAMFEDAREEARDFRQSMSILRLLKVLRLVRMARLVRMLRLIAELRTLVMAIASALRRLMWALALLCMMTYVVGVYFTQLTLDHRLDLDCSGVGCSSDSEARLVDYFGTLGDSTLTVYKAVTGGVDWGDVVEPLRTQISVWLAPGFMLYVAFVLLCVLNIITGVFVESSVESAKHDKASYMVSWVKSIFDEFDADDNGSLQRSEFQAALGSKDMKSIFKTLEIDPSESDALFHLLDVRSEGRVSPAEFASGCVRLSGTSKALELALHMREFSDFAARFAEFSESVDWHLRRISSKLDLDGASLGK